jgi:hypothetical protein
MKKCYILGAGASYGYDESLSKEMRPPLTNEFFIKGKQIGLFENEFPDLHSMLLEYIELTNIEIGNIDIEIFLDWLISEYNRCIKDKTKRAKNESIHRALSQTYYFIYEIIRYYSLRITPGANNYKKLVQYFNACKYGIITLNYDLFIEITADRIGLRCHNVIWPQTQESIPIAKIHGSINWINPRLPMKVGTDDFYFITQYIHSNRVNGFGNMKILQLCELKNTTFKDLVKSGEEYYEPALIPPFSNFKDYDKIRLYRAAWSLSESMLREADEIIIIGCSIRKEDIKFNELLKSELTNEKNIIIVDKKPDCVESNLNTILRSPKIVNKFSSFSEYVRTL